MRCESWKSSSCDNRAQIQQNQTKQNEEEYIFEQKNTHTKEGKTIHTIYITRLHSKLVKKLQIISSNDKLN